MTGRVIKATGSWYSVMTADGTIHQCRIKGKMRLTDRRTTNPVAIGDLVEIEEDSRGADMLIKEVLPRNNYIIRQSSKSRTAEHVLAANLDQAVLIASLTQPFTPPGFIDRFLVTATAYHIPAVLVFNKIDLYEEEQLQKLEEFENIYSDAGYTVLLTSIIDKSGILEFKDLLQNKITLISGNSGVGKSSIVNIIAPGLSLRTGSISDYHQKGTHTTTFAEMFALPFGGSIIDTPGIKEFGILDFEKEEVSHYFPEMERLLHDCRFNNCLHINEPNCAVIAAVEKGHIAYSRYNSYIGIIDEIENEEKIYD